MVFCKLGIYLLCVFNFSDANSTKFDEVWDSFNFPSKVPYVAVRLVKDSEGANQFAQFFPTPVYPVCYIIGLNAQPLEVVTAMEEITADRLSNSMSKAITVVLFYQFWKGLSSPSSLGCLKCYREIT